MDHVLLTRYNLPSSAVENRIRGQDNWLRDRTALFERYTLPSVRRLRAALVPAGGEAGGHDGGGNGHRLHWIVYVDPQSPPWFLTLMERLESEGVLTPVRRTSVSHDELVEDLRRVVGRDHGPLVTTNLDNDDSLASDFSARVTAVDPGPGGRTAVYLAHGLVLRVPGLYLHHDPDNAFCSVREDLADPMTCWADWHNRLHLHMPVEVLDGAPGWLQVVHGTNVSNTVRGRRVARAPYLARFGSGLDEVVDASRTEMARERLLSGPVRAARDRGRATARRAVVAVFGKSGLDALKARVVRR